MYDSPGWSAFEELGKDAATKISLFGFLAAKICNFHILLIGELVFHYSLILDDLFLVWVVINECLAPLIILEIRGNLYLLKKC